MTNTDIFFIKLTNFTTSLICTECGVRAEVVEKNEHNEAVATIIHLPTCQYAYLNTDPSTYIRHPITKTDLNKFISLFENGKTINGIALEECLKRNGLT